MISKEVLSEVLGLDVLAVAGEVNGELKYWFDESCGNKVSRESKINIYELAHLCKEWAIKYKCTLTSGMRWHDKTYDCLVHHCFDTEENTYFESKKSEYVAVCKACNWIFKRIKG